MEKNLIREDQPSYKALEHGLSCLTTAELICLLIQDGTKQKHIENSRELLSLANYNLNELGKLTVSDLMKVGGIGISKALTIAAAFEFSRRKHMAGALEKKQIVSSKDVADYLQQRIGSLQVEVFTVMFLNRANKINHIEDLSKGGVDGTVVDPKVVLKLALQHNATSLILSHNHPSGNLQPSVADKNLTEKIKQAASYLDMKILDHVIVSETGYYSFADEGNL